MNKNGDLKIFLRGAGEWHMHYDVIYLNIKEPNWYYRDIHNWSKKEENAQQITEWFFWGRMEVSGIKKENDNFKTWDGKSISEF